MAFSHVNSKVYAWAATVGMAVTTAIAAQAQPLPTLADSDLITQFTTLNNQVTIEFNNETGAPLTYEVLGITDQRLLPPEQSVLLQNIPLDATITAVRNDNGLIDITGNSDTEGKLSLSIVQEANFDNTQGVIIIERSGQVFAY